MIRTETIRVALDGLRANKLKAFLTSLGVMIGSACIVLVVTIALTGKRYVIEQIEAVGSNLVYAQYVREGQSIAAAASDEITLADLDAVRQLPAAVEVAGTRETPITVVVGGLERPVSLVGVTEGFQNIRRLVVLRGRFLDRDDAESRSKVGVITEELAQLVFPNADPIGQPIRVGEFQFTVVGVFKERAATFGQSEIKRETVLIPYPIIRYFVEQEFIRVLYAQAARPEDVPALSRQVEDVLRSRHRPGAVYRVQNLQGVLQAASNISLALTVVLLAVALIALVVGGIGIMNIMLVTVAQRTREIGIRKAIGARRSEILWQFLLEAFLISGAGAIIGIAIAVSIPILVQPFLPGNLRVPISWISVVVAFAVTCFAGVLFGYLPASRAAQLPPVESLRYE